MDCIQFVLKFVAGGAALGLVVGCIAYYVLSRAS